MVLSDRSIKEEVAKGRIVIEPFDPSCVQPASVDVHLAPPIRVFRPWNYPHYIDLRQSLDGLTEVVDIEEDHYFSLQPGQFVLGSTVEYIVVPDDLMARLEGKSSLGRIGLLIHATAGYVDPGWRGHLTLELYNVSPMPILLYPGMKISQISFHRLTTPAERPYGAPGLGSKYLEQVGPTPTRYYQEYQQPSLMSLSSIPVSPKQRPSARRTNVLREWLRQSEFEGSVRQFAQVLGIARKTVENWLYRGAEPSLRYRTKVFQATQLAQYKPPSPGEPLKLETSPGP